MSIFNIICNNINVKFDNGFTYENFIGQFQKHSSKILCIVNQKILHIYDKNDTYPELLKFEYTKKHNDINEFYFKNRNNDLYCFFGKEALTFLNINDINSYNEKLQIAKSKAEQSKAEQSKAEQSKAEQSKAEQSKAEQSKVEQSKVEQSKAEQSKAEQSKVEQSKVEQSKTDLIEIERLQIEQSKVEKLQNEQSKKDLSQIKQSKADLIEIERLQIKQSKNNNQLRNNSDIKSINIDSIKNLNVVDRIAPNIITIIDKGEKLLFTNYDYEIHITEFE
jgi:hypothetical protein